MYLYLSCLCKPSRRDDSLFARKHSDKSPKEFQALMLTKFNGICRMRVNLHDITPSVEIKLVDRCSSFDGFDITLALPCDGLLLCTTFSFKAETKIVVWNPCTDQTKWIRTGNSRDTNSNFVLGYSKEKKSCGKSYKILSFCNCKKDSEIYELDTLVNGDINPWNVRYSSYHVSLKVNAYWFAYDKGVLNLLKFDFSTEKPSGYVPLPYHCHRFEMPSLSVVREEKISVLFQRESNSKPEVRVTNKIDETREVSWSKVLTLDLSLDIQILYTISFLLDEEKKVVVCCDPQTYIDESDKSESKDMVFIVGEDNKVTQMDFGVNHFGSCWQTISYTLFEK